MRFMNSLESSFLVAVAVSKLREEKLAASFSSCLAAPELEVYPIMRIQVFFTATIFNVTFHFSRLENQYINRG